jgi:hypothetical protein
MASERGVFQWLPKMYAPILARSPLVSWLMAVGFKNAAFTYPKLRV